MTLTKGSLGEENAKKVSKESTDIISSLGGKVLESDFWGKRKLAYKIGQEKDGFYEVLVFEFQKDQIKDLKTKLNLVENLVRYLISAVN